VVRRPAPAGEEGGRHRRRGLSELDWGGWGRLQFWIGTEHGGRRSGAERSGGDGIFFRGGRAPPAVGRRWIGAVGVESGRLGWLELLSGVGIVDAMV
jgi:hypothetical protein